MVYGERGDIERKGDSGCWVGMLRFYLFALFKALHMKLVKASRNGLNLLRFVLKNLNISEKFNKANDLLKYFLC